MFELSRIQVPRSRSARLLKRLGPLGAALGVVALLVTLSTAGPTSAPAQARQRSSARPQGFQEFPGVRELSSRLIARPVQESALRAEGYTDDEAQRRVAEARRVITRYELLHYVPQTDEYVVQLPPQAREAEVAAALMASADFQYVEPDWIVFPIGSALPQRQEATGDRTYAPPTLCPDDPLLPQQWHHQADRLQSCDGWAIHTGVPSVSIGICDTGIRTTHEDLQLHRLQGYNAVDRLWESQGGAITPVHPHGTMTTGTAAANGDNGVGVVGVGWNLSHRMLRVSNVSSGGAFLTDLQHAARTSIESGDRVASVSYSGVTSASNLTTATYVKSIGGLLVWAAGNNSANLNFADRDADDLIVAGATDSGDALAYFSAYGSFVDLVAPGVGVLTCDAGSDSDYAAVNGTSFSCPLAAGLCALMWSIDPGLTPDDVESALKLGADDIGAAGVDDVFGYGRINLPGSLRLVGDVPPAADFVGAPTSGLAPLQVQFSDQSAGIPTSWAWDFGDGSSSTLQNPQHTYLSSGMFTVSLIATNDHGSDQLVVADYVVVDLIPPVADFSGQPTSGASPLPVDFTDLSSGGVATAWSWDFGDGGTSTLQNPSHTYATSGLFTVTLTVSNAYGSDIATRSNYVAVDVAPPVADFSGQPTVGVSPLSVRFTDLSTGVPSSWLWDFGDGATSTLRNPTHVYTIADGHDVSLRVTNALGTDFKLIANYIDVFANPPPVANFSGTPRVGSAPLTVDFTDLSGGYITSWLWSFGDGTQSTEQHPSHVYTAPGLYSVNLIVTNSDHEDELELEDYITVTP